MSYSDETQAYHKLQFWNPIQRWVLRVSLTTMKRRS
jgi:hypothetical protein